MSFIVKGISLEEITRGNGYAWLLIEEDGTVLDDISDIIGEAIQIPKGHGTLVEEFYDGELQAKQPNELFIMYRSADKDGGRFIFEAEE